MVAVPELNRARPARGGDPAERAAERTSYLPRIAARRPVAEEPGSSPLRANSGELPDPSPPGTFPDRAARLGSVSPAATSATISEATRELPVVDADGYGDGHPGAPRASSEGPDIPLLTHETDGVLRAGPAGAVARPAPEEARSGPSHAGGTGSARRRVRRPAVLVAAVVALAAVAAAAYWFAAPDSEAPPGAPRHTVGKGEAGGPPAEGRGTGPRGSAPNTETIGTFVFTKHHGPVRARNCAEHSYGRTHRFFTRTPCRWMTRTLYESSTPKGAVVSSVAVVRMPSPAQARSLKRITDTDGSGNVTDLVSDGINVVDGPRRIRGEGYASTIDGATVTIVESGSGDGRPGNAYLKRVSAGAARVVA